MNRNSSSKSYSPLGSSQNSKSKFGSSRRRTRSNSRSRQSSSFSKNKTARREDNRRRVEAMYKLHQRKQAQNLQNNRAGLAHSSRGSNHPPNRSNDSRKLVLSNDTALLKTLVKDVKQLTEFVYKNNKRFVENDRRSTRLEVTVNKMFIMLGDLSNGINVRMLLGNSTREARPPKGYHAPRLPVKRLKDLTIINRDFKNKDFFNFMVNR